MHVVVVSSSSCAAKARLTVRTVTAVDPLARVDVVDLDGSYVAVGTEAVCDPLAAGVNRLALHALATQFSEARLVDAVRPLAVAAASADAVEGEVVLSIVAGVAMLDVPAAIVAAAAAGGVGVVARSPSPVPDDGRAPTLGDVARVGSCSTALIAVRAGADALATWARAAAEGDVADDRWLDLAAATGDIRPVSDPAALVSAWSLRPEHAVRDDGRLALDGRTVVALDMSALDPSAPWLLDPGLDGNPRARLSEHPALAARVLRAAEALRAEPVGPVTARWDRSTIGLPLDAISRPLLLEPGAPDPFDPATAPEVVAWLTASEQGGWPGRYLRALRERRTDLAAAFPRVPGADAAAYLRWVARNAADEGVPREIVDGAVAAGRAADGSARPAPGVNVVGFLRGELGIGESARLLIDALDAAGIPHASRSVDRHLKSRQRAGHVSLAADPVFDTTVVCVNADLTPSVASSVPDLLARSYRIGMWYWEVEDFPASQHAGFAAVDEVWVATDFVRRAIEPHSPVPVVTLTPPLPQRRAEPVLGRAELGLPDAPLLLFSFDYLSTMERKNPLGLVDAFGRAFAPGEGPVLVLKSINGDKRPLEAERVRLAVAGRPDVLLIEEYLDADARDALVACCDAYISLHRSEGLGLTMAEAMAWGKPVVATGYSGNLQFMTEENSFLVPWTPTPIPPEAAPYPAGGVWAQPDLDAAARLLRMVIDDPAEAACRGARAARDIATLHSAAAAGAAIAARLEALSAARRRASRRHDAHRTADRAGRVADAVRRRLAR